MLVRLSNLTASLSRLRGSTLTRGGHHDPTRGRPEGLGGGAVASLDRVLADDLGRLRLESVRRLLQHGRALLRLHAAPPAAAGGGVFRAPPPPRSGAPPD